MINWDHLYNNNNKQYYTHSLTDFFILNNKNNFYCNQVSMRAHGCRLLESTESLKKGFLNCSDTGLE